MAAEMTLADVVANMLDVWGIGDDLTDPPGELGAMVMKDPSLLVDIADRVGQVPNDWAVAEAVAFAILDERRRA